MNLSAFHDYDIRGIYPTEINEEFYFKLGKAIAAYIGESPIAVGEDMRVSSPSLSKSLIDGILSQGIDVISLGQISTEIHYFASAKYNFAANVIVSASHNPPEYNGAKIVKRGVVPLHGTFGLDKLKELMTEDKFTSSEKKGALTSQNIFDDWIKHALTFVDTSSFSALKVAVDAGNGMGGPSWKEIAKYISPVDIVGLFLDPDGTFPNHLADPLKEENVADLKKTILEKKCDFGIALDGDADRIFFMDESGRRLSGTITTAIFADYFLKREKAAILYNVIIGRIVPETIKKLGGTPIRTRVGHSIIKEELKKNRGIFAAEHSGHLYFRDNFYAESSLIAGLIMIAIISQKQKKLSQIAAEYDIYAQSPEMNFTVLDTQKVIATIKKDFSDAKSIDELDGISIWYDNYWFNIRSSKTEPLLRLNVEADNKEILDGVVKKLSTKLIDLGAVKK